MKYFLILLLLLSSIMFSGCEQIDENSDSSTNDSYAPSAANTCNQSEETTLGCYGEDLLFGDNENLTEGFWSIYAKRDSNLHYYNTYLFSYEFSNQGFVGLLNKLQESVFTWGINKEGSKIRSLSMSINGSLIISRAIHKEYILLVVLYNGLKTYSIFMFLARVFRKSRIQSSRWPVTTTRRLNPC